MLVPPAGTALLHWYRLKVVGTYQNNPTKEFCGRSGSKFDGGRHGAMETLLSFAAKDSRNERI